MYNRNSIPPFAALKAFDAFGRFGGIRKAAKALDVDHAVISRHLRALEVAVGTALIDRTPSDNWLTEDGAAYHARISAALSEIADTTDALRRRHDNRFLIWSSPGFANYWLLPRLPQFNERFPNIDLALRPSDKSADFTKRDADGDIRYLHTHQVLDQPPDVRVMEFDRPAIFAVASPTYLDTLKYSLAKVADLLHTRLLHEEDDLEWRDWLKAHDVDVPPDLAGPRLWHANLVIDAARKGQGIALANKRLVGDLLNDGSLVAITFTDEDVRHVELGGYHLIARGDRWTSISLVRFRDWLRSNMSEPS